MQISYRCPRCRDCVDCKKSFETERVSLREEQEDQMVHDSIRIDWENKQIECKLPVRGEEHQFLSNNRDIALKILDQQCNKHHKDVETRELICKSFDKLMKNGHMVLWDSLTEDEKKVIEAKKVSHWLPWRVVFKDSLSTPCRAVFDASSNTKVDADGNGGRSLNDLVVKGKVTTLNLMKMITRFQAGQHAVQGDLKQFYASIKLVLEQWNLQRVLFRENLDPKGKLIEAIIKSLIWGIKCVSALSEASVIKLAEFIKEKLPDLYKLLVDSRFCDDIGASSNSMEKLKATTKEADNLFDSVGLACKGWSYSGEKPSVDVSEDGLISIGGMKWDPIMDTLEVLIPKLHFSRKSRGRLIVGTQVFEGSMMEELEEFVPKDLSRRTIFSKNSSIYDPCGKLAPVLGILKVDLRLVSKLTEEWDDTIPASARSKWLKNFMLLERLRGMKFQRAMMPSDAVSSRMNLIVAGDVAEANVEMFGAWARFKRKNGTYSCQQILGRSLLADEDSTMPKKELNVLTRSSNMGWLLNLMLDDWMESYIVIGDSTIAFCWTTSERKRLSLFHRNRVIQIKRGTNINQMYHVITSENPADLGTRPDLVKLSDVGPNSPWDKGKEWMRGEINDAVSAGILTPVTSLRLKEEQEEDYKKGFIYEKSPEILTKGHLVLTTNSRLDKVMERQLFSDYLIPPNKWTFEKVVRVQAMVRKWFRDFKCSKKRKLLEVDPNHQFQMFPVHNAQCSVNSFTFILIKTTIDDYQWWSWQWQIPID